MKPVTKNELNEQLRAVFGDGVEHDADQRVSVYNKDPSFTVVFKARPGESLKELRSRIIERLDQLPCEGA